MLQKAPASKSLGYSESERERWGSKTDSRGLEKKNHWTEKTFCRSLSYFFHSTNLKALNRLPEATTINFAQLKLTLIAQYKKKKKILLLLKKEKNLHISYS